MSPLATPRIARHVDRRLRIARATAPVIRTCAVAVEPLDPRVLLTGSVAATVANDLNRNGVRDSGEPGLSGWTVYVDLDRSGTLTAGEPSAVTNGSGLATITGVAKGTWDVREVLPSGWTTAPGQSDFDRLQVKDNETATALFLNVTATTGGTIAGTVRNDVNGDGILAATDPGLPGWTIYLDLNDDRAFESTEPSRVTDANGAYSFTNLAPGRYRVREVSQPNWDTTVGFDGAVTADVTAGRTTTANFANFNVASIGSISGSVWNDVNADGARAAGDPGLEGWTVFLDTNSNSTLDVGETSTLTDAAGRYAFNSVTVGTYRVAEVLQPSWLVSPGHANAVNVTVVSEGNAVADFANFTPTKASLSGTVYNDANGSGTLNAGEAGLSGWTIFLDQNGDGALGVDEPSTLTDAAGQYSFTGVAIGSVVVRQIAPVGWRATAPGTGSQLVTLLNADNRTGINFGNQQRTDSAIGGVAFVDTNRNGTRDAGERGLPGITVYLDTNDNGTLDAGEPSVVTSKDQFFTPSINEAGGYSFTHLATGTYHVREVLPAELSATPTAAQSSTFLLSPGEDRTGVSFANVFRANEIHGVSFNDLNGNGTRDPDEPGLAGVTIYVDLNRNDIMEAGEPRTVSGSDGSYAFTTGLAPGAYVIREIHKFGQHQTYPNTTAGVLWPSGVSNPAIGNVSPTSITESLATGETSHHTVSVTLPGSGALTNMVDVFLLFDDTGSFTANSPIVRAAFPQIISALQAALPGIDLGFGVGRFEEYANFASENATGRPFILNQPIISQATPGFSTAIQSALDRTAPGYGGDQPETVWEALYQTVTGVGFDGNNNGTTTDSGAAGQVSTQLTPGDSGDVPAFTSFTVDAAGNVLPSSGTIGGAGFRAGALPIILTATDTGFAFQPMPGETSITGINGLTLPISSLTQTSRATTPFNSGATIQQTITGLNALGALVIGLGTNPTATADPRLGLESIARLTGATNQSAVSIPNGTLDPIDPGDPLYFEIASGFGASVANGVVAAISNAATNVSLNISVRASDPRVHLIAQPGVINGVSAGQTATFDVEFTGDGMPHRFDLQFVRDGSDVVVGSIPVVVGTPISGDGYEYDELEEGEIHQSVHFGNVVDVSATPVNVTSSFDYQTRQAIVLQFDQDVSSSLDASDLVITNMKTGATVPVSQLNYDPATFRATALFGSTLPDADYRLTIAADAVTNLAAANQLDFFVLAGDVNHDRTVNFADLVILAQNYNAIGRTFAQGNVNYSADGKVDFADLVILAQHYNATLGLATPAASLKAPVKKTSVAASVLGAS